MVAKSIRFSILLLLSTLVWGSLSLAELPCEDQLKLGPAPQGRSLPKVTQDLQAVLQLLPAQGQAAAQHILDATVFIDYPHMIPQLVDSLMSGKDNLSFVRLYQGRGEADGVAFDGFLEAKKYLATQRPPANFETLTQIHRRFMQGGVEGLNSDYLGRIRDVPIIGNLSGNLSITVKEGEHVLANPYLGLEQIPGPLRPLDAALWSSLALGLGPDAVPLPIENPEYINGRILYPSPQKGYPDSAIELVRETHPELYLKVQAFREGKLVAQAPPIAPIVAPPVVRRSLWQKVIGIFKAPDVVKPKVAEPGAANSEEALKASLQQELVAALINDRFARFEKDRAALGKVVIGTNEQAYIDLVADFKRDLVSIHPFVNGNGRSIALYASYLLNLEGLPGPHVVDPFLDIQSSRDEWRAIVRAGMDNTIDLFADFTHRLKFGYHLRNSPELLYPNIPDVLKIDLLKQGSKVQPEARTAEVDKAQFTAFFQALMKQKPELLAELTKHRLRAMSRIVELFVEWYRSKTIRYIHDKDGDREIKLRFVDQDFIDTFAQIRAERRDLWVEKMRRWYDTDLLIWRGLSNSSYVHTDSDLLALFSSPSQHMASNRVLGARTQNAVEIRRAMLADFQSYNAELLNGKLSELAKDHQETGPRYRDSYGFSTSKREIVGKAFAMGAMVIAPYGQQDDPILQQKLKSRINVAAYRGWKDVDLGRLKIFDSRFSSTYGRQAEVMGIGGADPDSIMLVQRIDGNGEVIESFVRNHEKPNEIMVVTGRFVPSPETPHPTAVQRRYTLTNGQWQKSD